MMREQLVYDGGAMPLLYYVHDPMCSWCWAFRPVWNRVKAKLPESVTVKYLLGGLAPDSDTSMIAAQQAEIQGHWKAIQSRVPGTMFNFDFWRVCTPRRSTYPACRAVIAARRQKPLLEDAMIRAIQEAYYLQARNPSDDDVLVSLAATLGLKTEAFRADLNAPAAQKKLMADIRIHQGIGVRGFPGLVLETRGNYRQIRIDYNNANAVLHQIQKFAGLY